MLHTNLTIRERTDAYIHARYQHPAWVLLASRRGPLVLSCLRGLFDEARGDVGFDDALQSLAQALADHANHAEFDIGTADCTALARKELRAWIKRELVVERGGNLYATDALEEAMRFVEALGDRVMTSTASRLSVVQREIEIVEGSLNPDPKSRAHRIRQQIADLEAQLSAVEAGHVETLDRDEAVERIREIFNLATSLRADFRRVEDSWREADRALRQSMVGGDSHRGDIMDKLLDGHDDLLDTPEGRVFQGFQQQLSRKIELDDMKLRLRTILSHPFCAAALNQQQHTENKRIAEVLTAAKVALELSPGCARGRPLRALSVGGIDTKFFERHRTLVVQFLDVLFDGEVDNLGLEGFLGALDEEDHWLLLAPLEQGLLPFRQQRIRTQELVKVTLPGSRVLIVENEKSLYQLPQVSDTIAILGAGLNLGWLECPGFERKQLAYWGDLDTWGLQMLATARRYRPKLRMLLMTRDIFDAHAAGSAVAEPDPADESPPIALSEAESMLYRHLRTLERGRLEQEFLPTDLVGDAVASWAGGRSP